MSFHSMNWYIFTDAAAMSSDLDTFFVGLHIVGGIETIAIGC